MRSRIDILVVGSPPEFVTKADHALRDAGLSFHIETVQTAESVVYELEHHPPDAILSYHGLPSFHRFVAVTIARQKRPDLPVILVSASRDEVPPDETIPTGATSDVLKTSLTDLAPTLRGALRESRERIQLRNMALAVLTSRWRA